MRGSFQLQNVTHAPHKLEGWVEKRGSVAKPFMQEKPVPGHAGAIASETSPLQVGRIPAASRITR
jgi:hypothetical protein